MRSQKPESNHATHSFTCDLGNGLLAITEQVVVLAFSKRRVPYITLLIVIAIFVAGHVHMYYTWEHYVLIMSIVMPAWAIVVFFLFLVSFFLPNPTPPPVLQNCKDLEFDLPVDLSLLLALSPETPVVVLRKEDVDLIYHRPYSSGLTIHLQSSTAISTKPISTDRAVGNEIKIGYGMFRGEEIRDQLKTMGWPVVWNGRHSNLTCHFDLPNFESNEF